MTYTLPLLSAQTPLAALFNRYLTGLAPAVEAVAPRLSLREFGYLCNNEDTNDAARLFYRFHIVAAALARLHDAYSEAIELLKIALRDDDPVRFAAEHEGFRLALAGCFATRTDTGERIGSAYGSVLFDGASCITHARGIARRLGLPVPRLTTPKGQPAPDTAFPLIESLLSEGQRLAGLFATVEDAQGYARLYKDLIRVQQVKGFGPRVIVQ